MRGARVVQWVSEIPGDIRYSLRSWGRQPGFAAVAVISLAAGIGLNTAVFSIINTIFFQPVRGVSEPGRIVGIDGRIAYAAFRDIRDGSRAMTEAAAWQPMRADIRFRDVSVRRTVPAVSERYFSVLGVRPARGRFFEPASARQPNAAAEVVLDHEFWTGSLAGDPSVIGETVVINGVPATILGIAPRAFHGFGPERPPLWISMGMAPAVRSLPARWEDPAETGWRVFGRLRDGAAAAQVETELKTLAAQSPALFPDGPLRASITGGERLSGPVAPEKRIEFLLVVVLPLIVVGLILWIGCSNVANLLLARAAARRKEMAIRLATGATRSRLVRLLLTESLVLASAGGALGFLIAGWTISLVWATLPEVPRLAVELDGRVLFYTAVVCVIATLVFGLVPAVHATRVDVAPLLKGDEAGRRHTARGARVRTFFLVTQFATSMALLVVAGTFVRTLGATYVGEQSVLIDHVAVAYVESRAGSGPARLAYWTRVREALSRLPDFGSATLTQPEDNRRARLVPDGSEPVADRADVLVQRIDSSFFRTAGMGIVAGRDDLGEAGGAVEKALINERAARQFWRTTDVVGRRFSLGTGPSTPPGTGPSTGAALEISGVVRDDGAEPRVFRRLTDDAVSSATILVRTSRPSATAVEPLRALLLGSSGDRAFLRVSTFRESALGGLQRITTLALIVAALVLALASVGLYGSISFVTSQRMREVAIRQALGAPRQAVLRLLARDAVLVVAGGSVLGLALTAAGFQFMSGMIFARWTLDPITVAGVLLVFAMTTAGACYVPGRRAMRIDPMRVLRSD